MKRNVFILLIICLLSLVRVVEAQEVIESDTIYTTQEHAQPTDDKRRVVTNPFWDNWFLNAGPTVSYYIGDYHSDGSTGLPFFSGILCKSWKMDYSGIWFDGTVQRTSGTRFFS